MKKFLALFLSISMVLCSNFAIANADSSDISVLLNGKTVEFDVTPRLIGGRTMVPLRAIFESLGAEVNWDEDTQTVTAYNEISIVKCTIDNNTMYVNNVPKTIDVPPMMIDDRTLVPVRFIAESFNCDVSWNPDTLTVSIDTKPIDYSNVEQDSNVKQDSNLEQDSAATLPAVKPSTSSNTASSSQSSSVKGTRSNPYSASDGETVTFQEYSFKPSREIAITCTNVIRGNSANTLAHSENRYNDEPSSSQEWIFMEFNVNYISSSDGDDDILKGSDVIYEDTFFTTSGSSVSVTDMATLGDKYRGNGVFDVELYPGASSKVVIGLLIDKNIGDILLRIPNKTADSNTWINCTNHVSYSDSESENIYDNADNDDDDDDSDNNATNNNVASCYPGTTIPTYTSIVGTPLLKTFSHDNGNKSYTYNFNEDDFLNYYGALLQRGWTELNHEKKDLILTYYMRKGSKVMALCYAAQYSQVWVLP